MRHLHPGYWAAWIGGTVLCLVIAWSCERTDTPTSAAAPTTMPTGMEQPMPAGDHALVASPAGDGVYFMSVDGVYLIRGTEAVKVKEVASFTPPRELATH